jgi:L1 cell adhesion molecule like protein
MKLWPFRVEGGPEGRPVVLMRFRGESKKFEAEEISAMVLARMKETAEGFLGRAAKMRW